MIVSVPQMAMQLAGKNYASRNKNVKLIFQILPASLAPLESLLNGNVTTVGVPVMAELRLVLQNYVFQENFKGKFDKNCICARQKMKSFIKKIKEIFLYKIYFYFFRNLEPLKCVPGTTFRDAEDCNDCFCTERGEVACTDMLCSERVKRSLDPTAPDFSCTPGMSFKWDCNTCTCMANGKFAACTMMACLPKGLQINSSDVKQLKPIFNKNSKNHNKLDLFCLFFLGLLFTIYCTYNYRDYITIELTKQEVWACSTI